jgi:hypothetical protein
MSISSVTSSPLAPVLPPDYPQAAAVAGCDPQAVRAELQQVLTHLEEQWPSLKGDWQTHLTLLNQDRAELQFRGMRIEIEGLQALDQEMKELHQQERDVEAKREVAVERLGKIKHVNTALSVMSTGFRLGAGTGLIVGGAVVPGAVVIGSALISSAHEVAKRLEYYQQLSQSMGGDERSVAERAQMIQSSVGWIDLALSIATTLFGGTEGLSAGWKSLTNTQITPEGMSNLSGGARGLMSIAQSKLYGDKGRLEVDYARVRVRITLHQEERENRQERLEASLDRVEKYFSLGIEQLKANQLMNSVLARNIGQQLE